MSRFLGRDDILTVPDRKPVAFPVPQWATDGEEVPSVWIRKLNGRDRQALNKILAKTEVDTEIEQAAFIACVSDEHGQPLFTQEDGPMIADKFAGVIARIARRALAVNAFGRAALETAEKN